jgi:hypothetical protein
MRVEVTTGSASSEEQTSLEFVLFEEAGEGLRRIAMAGVTVTTEMSGRQIVREENFEKTAVRSGTMVARSAKMVERSGKIAGRFETMKVDREAERVEMKP